MKPFRNVIAAALLLTASLSLADVLPDVPEGAQAVSLMGQPLYAAEPSADALKRLDEARKAYESDPDDPDKLIWYGRRMAYTGDFRRAIEIYSEGIEKFPDDAHLYRHRGHRYISIREFDRAIDDLTLASELIEGTENEIEPDGLPNAQNIPVSSKHGNIWYHLGLAHYLKHDWENAYRAYKKGFETGGNDDNRVSTTHWLYSILQRKGDPEAAAKVLDVISKDMNVIENHSYHNLCLFYKGELSVQEVLGEDDDSPASDSAEYGVANWYYYTGEEEKAKRMLEAMLTTPGWASFGYIAAEADLASR